MDREPIGFVETETAGSRFFRRIDWAAFWTALAVSLAVYSYTLAPTVTLEDSGELAVAGDYLGVPHPPGYPIWTVFAFAFSKVFAFVTFRGQPNPAWAVALVSAVFGALATGLSAMLVCRSGSDLLRELHKTDHLTSTAREHVICWAGGVVGSLLFAFSPVMWSQSVINEVYSLNAFFLMLVFLLTYRWMYRPSDGLLYATAFVFGLGLTNYQVLLLAALPLVFAVFLRDVRLFRDFAIAGAPYLVAIALIKGGQALGITHPLDMTGAAYLGLNLLILTLVFFFLPRGRTVAISLALAQVGVGFYGLMPIVSDLRNPPMNWGYPRTWEGFLHAISRGQYERISPTDVFSPLFIHQIGAYLTDLRGQFTLPVALLGFLPFTVWSVRVGDRRFRAMYVAVPLCILATVLVVADKAFPRMAAADLYKLPIVGVIGILGVGGVALFANQIVDFFNRLIGRVRATLAERVTVALALAGAGLAYLYYTVTLAAKCIDVVATGGQAGAAAASPAAAQVAGLIVLIVAPAAMLAAVIWLMRGPMELRINIDLNSQRWIIATLLGFLVMSVMLIALANPKGDIQDDFIQRVKFISSHGLYAVWIGYGLIFGLALVDAFFQRSRPIKAASVLAAIALSAVPIRENAVNADLVRKSGGAEQNGHDFGWQFGNYQLRGAEAIAEELDPQEEPLPNPRYPDPMGRDAIFFGGTDPGRFVPTYMIYSARVREDVYLITQNALADNTYMSVMRDLYGDRIWIPAQPDSARAFQRYVDEVRAGTRPRNADLRIENGRVQVSGALGVMEINGILAQMIFEHNNYRHDFYVEESYVIRWMYDYLTPHGLIMKINRDKTRLSPAVIRDDMDFWDWYTRRLTGDTAFRRDVVARKSFSKLRSAIAGLYANRGLFVEAEDAFKEARLLYPLSPEANFRLAQEVYAPRREFERARVVMEEFGRMDPGNSKVSLFVDELKRLQKLHDRINALEKKRQEGRIDVQSALELAECYYDARQQHLFLAMLRNVIANPALPPQFLYKAALLLRKARQFKEMVEALQACEARLPPDTPAGIYLDIGRLYAEANQSERTAATLEKYLRIEPRDWKAWLDLATVRTASGKKTEAMQALERALSIGGAEARDLVGENRQLAPLLRAVAPRGPDTITGLPGVTPNP